jgi:hypothetical protein
MLRPWPLVLLTCWDYMKMIPSQMISPELWVSYCATVCVRLLADKSSSAAVCVPSSES